MDREMVRKTVRCPKKPNYEENHNVSFKARVSPHNDASVSQMGLDVVTPYK